MSADKFLNEVRYLRGEVMNDPQTWSETQVSGGGGGGSYGHTSSVSISSSTSTYTSFLIETDEGKEYMVKWPEAASVRKGHHIKVAVFRNETIALINEKTDTYRMITDFNKLIKGNEVKAFPPLISYGVTLVLIWMSIPKASHEITGYAGIWTAWLVLIVWVTVWFFRKNKKRTTADGLAQMALDVLETK